MSAKPGRRIAVAHYAFPVVRLGNVIVAIPVIRYLEASLPIWRSSP